MKKFLIVFSLVLLVFSAANAKEKEVNRQNVTDKQANPNRIRADNLRYLRLGYGLMQTDEKSFGTFFGFGYRREMDQLGIDASFFNTNVGHQSNNKGYFTEFIRLQGLYYLSPLSNTTFYAGTGLSYSLSSITIEKNNSEIQYRGHGLAGVLTFGIEAMRVSNVRMFLQTDVILPFYQLKLKDKAYSATEDDKKYMPAVNISVGLAF